MTLYPQLIIDALATVTYAGTKKNLIESEMLADQPDGIWWCPCLMLSLVNRAPFHPPGVELLKDKI